MARAGTKAESDKAGREASSARERLLDEAARHLNARGISLASLTEIADSLGVTRPALYNHVEDREDLVFQCYRRSCEIMSARLGEAVADGGDALRIVGSFIDRMLDPDAPEIAALSEVDYLREDRRRTVLGLQAELLDRLRSILSAGSRRGEVRRCAFDVAANVLVGMIQWVQLAPRWSIEIEDVSRDRLRRSMRALLFDGVAFDREGSVLPADIDLSPLAPRILGAFERQPLAEAKREAILATASRLFNLKGVDAVSLDEVAAQLGATKRTIYHHLGDKQALIAACYLRAYRIFLFIADRAESHHGSRVQALAGAIRAAVLANLGADLSPLLPSAGLEVVRPDDRAEVARQSAAMTAAYVKICDDGVAEHSLRELDIDATLLILPGATGWVAKIATSVDESRHGHLANETATLVSIGLRPARA